MSRPPAPETLNGRAVAAAENEPAVDVLTIASLHKEGDDLLTDLVELFFAEMPKQLARIRDGLAACDWQVVRLAAHTLKGTAGTFGAHTRHDLAAKIEAVAYPEATEEVALLLEQLATQCERVRNALTEETAKLRANDTAT
jgi:two-component system sensor histidine kinase/response regulator